MRMTDACALLCCPTGQARGCIAVGGRRAAARTLARREGKVELTLQGGLTAPVSRAMQADLREQCWS